MWKLRRTLRRKTEFRPIEEADIKYIYAAYKTGALADIAAPGLSPVDFKRGFEAFILSRCHAAWTLFADTRKGFIPVGLVLGSWAPNAPYLIVSIIAWLPWASKRNIIESTVGFFNKARREFAFIGYALPEHKRMYEVCMMHGIMRRIGYSHVAIPGKSTMVFETKAPEHRAA